MSSTWVAKTQVLELPYTTFQFMLAGNRLKVEQPVFNATLGSWYLRLATELAAQHKSLTTSVEWWLFPGSCSCWALAPALFSCSFTHMASDLEAKAFWKPVEPVQGSPACPSYPHQRLWCLPFVHVSCLKHQGLESPFSPPPPGPRLSLAGVSFRLHS